MFICRSANIDFLGRTGSAMQGSKLHLWVLGFFNLTGRCGDEDVRVEVVALRGAILFRLRDSFSKRYISLALDSLPLPFIIPISTLESRRWTLLEAALAPTKARLRLLHFIEFFKLHYINDDDGLAHPPASCVQRLSRATHLHMFAAVVESLANKCTVVLQVQSNSVAACSYRALAEQTASATTDFAPGTAKYC